MYSEVLDSSIVEGASYFIIQRERSNTHFTDEIHQNRCSYWESYSLSGVHNVTYYSENSEPIITYKCDSNTPNKIDLQKKLDKNAGFPSLMYWRKMSNDCVKTGFFYGIQLMDKYFNSVFVVETDSNHNIPIDRVPCITHTKLIKYIDCNKLIRLRDDLTPKRSWFF